MSEFRDLENKAESYAKEHPDQVDKGLQEAGKFADRETGDKYDREVQGGIGAAEKHFEGQQSQDAGEGQGQQSQDPGEGQGS